MDQTQLSLPQLVYLAWAFTDTSIDREVLPPVYDSLSAETLVGDFGFKVIEFCSYKLLRGITLEVRNDVTEGGLSMASQV